MPTIHFFETIETIVALEVTNDNFGFPNLVTKSKEWQFIFVSYLATCLAIGAQYRRIIFSHLRDPRTKSVPINSLIWMDQVSGLFQGLNIVIKAIMIVTPVPLSDVFGFWICYWINYPGCVYACGEVTWSCLIAFLRIVYIKSRKQLKDSRMERNLLKYIIAVGSTIVFLASFIINLCDPNTTGVRLCSGCSRTFLDILYEYQGPDGHFLSIEETKTAFLGINYLGSIFSIVELLFYIVIFDSIRFYDNTIAATFISSTALKKRNNSNAISMVGQVVCWLLEIWFILCYGVLTAHFGFGIVHEYLHFLKDASFCLVPIVLVYTSPALKEILNGKQHHSD